MMPDIYYIIYFRVADTITLIIEMLLWDYITDWLSDFRAFATRCYAPSWLLTATLSLLHDCCLMITARYDRCHADAIAIVLFHRDIYIYWCWPRLWYHLLFRHLFHLLRFILYTFTLSCYLYCFFFFFMIFFSHFFSRFYFAMILIIDYFIIFAAIIATLPCYIAIYAAIEPFRLITLMFSFDCCLMITPLLIFIWYIDMISHYYAMLPLLSWLTLFIIITFLFARCHAYWYWCFSPMRWVICRHCFQRCYADDAAIAAAATYLSLRQLIWYINISRHEMPIPPLRQLLPLPLITWYMLDITPPH